MGFVARWDRQATLLGNIGCKRPMWPGAQGTPPGLIVSAGVYRLVAADQADDVVQLPHPRLYSRNSDAGR